MLVVREWVVTIGVLFGDDSSQSMFSESESFCGCLGAYTYGHGF
jgi:hypothetical protein